MLPRSPGSGLARPGQREWEEWEEREEREECSLPRHLYQELGERRGQGGTAQGAVLAHTPRPAANLFIYSKQSNTKCMLNDV